MSNENVIEGLKVTVPGADIRDLWEKKADHHDRRAGFYREREQSLIAAGITDDEKEKGKFASSSNNSNPLREARDDVARHENQAREARFWAKYIDLSKHYLLDANDLNRIGVLRARY